eukprot:3820564-Pyramimonas_sp.AAC.1
MPRGARHLVPLESHVRRAIRDWPRVLARGSDRRFHKRTGRKGFRHVVPKSVPVVSGALPRTSSTSCTGTWPSRPSTRPTK